MTRDGARTAVGLVTLLTLLVACSGPTDVNDKADEPIGIDLPSPFEEAFASVGGQDAAVRDWQYQVQETVAECMMQSGFEFVISVAPVPDMVRQRDELSELQWAERYGFGISTSADAVLQMQAQDPNSMIFLALSEGEQEEYLLTLMGEALATGSATGPVALDQQGCSGAAVLKHGGAAITEDMAELESTYSDQLREIETQPEMVVAIEMWQQCMAKEGYFYSHEEDILASLFAELDELLAPAREQVMALTPSELQQAFDNGTEFELLGIDPDVLAKFQERERAIAVADYACFEAHLAETLIPLRNQAQRTLLDTYSSEVDRAVALFSNN